jgi:myosin-crossreactive antigen
MIEPILRLQISLSSTSHRRYIQSTTFDIKDLSIDDVLKFSCYNDYGLMIEPASCQFNKKSRTIDVIFYDAYDNDEFSYLILTIKSKQHQRDLALSKLIDENI